MNKMFTSRKRKNKGKSRSDSEPKHASKVVVLDNPPGARDATNRSRREAMDSQVFEDFNRQLRAVEDLDRRLSSKEKKTSGIKRSGSKLLSMFRRWRSGSSHANKQSSSSSHAREDSLVAAKGIPLPLHRDTMARQSSATTHPLVYLGVEPNRLAAGTNFPVQSTEDQFGQQHPRHRSQAASYDTESSVLYIPPRQEWAGPSRPCSKRSSSSLKYIISHKLSDPFISPTVVHRPNLRSRPSVRSIHADRDLLENLCRDTHTLDRTDPSTQKTSANMSSPMGVSTGMTSLFSDGSGKQCADIRNNAQSQHQLAKSKDKSKDSSTVLEDLHVEPLFTIPEARTDRKPSIATVEVTANAKIFLETHFNNILSSPVSPRSKRRHAFEQTLLSMPLTFAQQAKLREEWAKQESDHLRQMRTLMTRPLDKPGVVIGGYEVVNVLGKGSFGVVRLVKEKNPISEIQEASSAQKSEQLSASPRSTVIGAIKSSVKASKHHLHRREATHMKNRFYAMKVIRKSNMLRNSQEGYLRAERDFLVASEGSRWIVPLIASFQDNTNLYLVMDFMVGGDFLGLLIREHTLDEDVTKWYIAEMILCVEEAHALNWIHRDVKPDNFLISASGHLKISDFGLAFDGHWSHDQRYFHHQRYSLMEKLGIEVKGDSVDQRQGAIASSSKMANVHTSSKERRQKHQEGTSDEGAQKEGILDWRNRNEMRSMAKSTVGTSQYMAPEIIRGEKYDGRCDWWSIGIIMFECLYGFTPFCMENREDTKRNILQHTTSLSFPSEVHVSTAGIDLMKSLVQEKEFRLSCRKYAENDFHFTRQTANNALGAASGHTTRISRGRYVYPNDASDIKAHVFFRGVPWSQLHNMRPPFVPRVKSWEDTRYFEEDEPISDVGDSSTSSSRNASSSTSNSHAAASQPAAAPANEQANPRRSLWNANEIPILGDSGHHRQPKEEAPAATKSRRNPNHKRPRDKILRDEEVGKQVLEIRKKGAFLGYTWRRHRPRAPATGTGTEDENLHDLGDKSKQQQQQPPPPSSFRRRSVFDMV